MTTTTPTEPFTIGSPEFAADPLTHYAWLREHAPVARALLTLYVLVPVVFDRPPARGAKAAFRMSEDLRPWSMAEVFAIGCAVALVKVVDLADVEFGPAFYMFSSLVVLVVVQDTFLCRYSVWKALEE